MLTKAQKEKSKQTKNPPQFSKTSTKVDYASPAVSHLT